MFCVEALKNGRDRKERSAGGNPPEAESLIKVLVYLPNREYTR